MKDNELRGVVLRKFYDLRREGPFQWAQFAKSELSFFEAMGDDLFRICDQLAEHGLIHWNPRRGANRGKFSTVGGIGEISAHGIDVVEGSTTPPISITFDRSINVHSSSHVQIGNSNIQTGDIALEKLIAAVNNSTATENEKAEAKSLLQKAFENPILKTILKTLLPSNPFV